MLIKKIIIIVILIIAWVIAINIAEGEPLKADNGTYSEQFIVQPTAILDFKDIILGMVESAGFSRTIASRIINCESGWNPKASHHNTNGTSDIGLWQINDIHGLSIEDREDPYKSTEYAIELMRSNRSYNHWVCY